MSVKLVVDMNLSVEWIAELAKARMVGGPLVCRSGTIVLCLAPDVRAPFQRNEFLHVPGRRDPWFVQFLA